MSTLIRGLKDIPNANKLNKKLTKKKNRETSIQVHQTLFIQEDLTLL